MRSSLEAKYLSVGKKLFTDLRNLPFMICHENVT